MPLSLEPPMMEAPAEGAMVTDASPEGLRVVRISAEIDACSNIYPESQVFTPDSRRFVFQRMVGDLSDLSMQRRRREYWLCDIADDLAVRQLTDEPEAIAPAISPDGRWCYYFLNNLDPLSRRGVELRRVNLRTFEREVVMRIDRALEGCPFDAPPSRLYSLATVRADGGAVCTGAFVGDGIHDEPGLWGLLVCDVTTRTARVIFVNRNLINPHVQYRPTNDPQAMADLLVQINMEVVCDATGRERHVGSGCLLSVMRDDGSDYRVVPCGGDADEVCHGHQEWRGGEGSVAVGVNRRHGDGRVDRPLIEAEPIPADPTDPTPPWRLPAAAAHRRDLTANLVDPQFAHTAFDPTGTLMVGDCYPTSGSPVDAARMFLAVAPLGREAPPTYRYLLHPRTSYTRDQITHPHACLSPDGRHVLFNSDHGGRPAVWLATGYPCP